MSQNDAFTAIDSSTGEVKFSGTAADPQVLAAPGLAILVGVTHPLDGWVETGEFYPLPPKPSQNHVFNWQTKQWEDPRTLVEVKAAKNDAINRARAAANSSYFVYQGHRIAVDQLSRSDIDATHGAILMLQALPPGWPGGWKSMDNVIVPIPDVPTWAQFYGTMVATGTANFNRAQALKAQLEAASTIPEVEALPNW